MTLPLNRRDCMKAATAPNAIAPTGMPGAPFMKGLNHPRYHDKVVARTSEMIEASVAHGVPSVIAFTSFKCRDADDPTGGDISLEEEAENCVQGLEQLVSRVEKNVTVCIEPLKTATRATTSTMWPASCGRWARIA